MALTPKQQRFVEEYLIDLNATQAAIRAGYSSKTANEQGARLLANVSIQTSIQEAIGKRSQRVEITQDWVLDELRKIAEANGSIYARVVTKEQPETVVDEETGDLKQVSRITQFVELMDTDNLTDDQKAAISGIEETRHGIKVNTYDRVKALELLGKHLGMFDGRAQSGPEREAEVPKLLEALQESDDK